eukprot:3939136-Rhodomonas_salina.2
MGSFHGSFKVKKEKVSSLVCLSTRLHKLKPSFPRAFLAVKVLDLAQHYPDTLAVVRDGSACCACRWALRSSRRGRTCCQAPRPALPSQRSSTRPTHPGGEPSAGVDTLAEMFGKCVCERVCAALQVGEPWDGHGRG